MEKLYVICDSRINKPVSAIIECPNDTMALFGFVDFCKKEKEKGLEPFCFRLKEIGTIDEERGVITDVVSRYIARGDKAEEMYGELVQKALDEEQGI